MVSEITATDTVLTNEALHRLRFILSTIQDGGTKTQLKRKAVTHEFHGRTAALDGGYARK